jgi:hypothetical protein
MAIEQGKQKPEEWATFVAQILAAQGQKIVKEGKLVLTLYSSTAGMFKLPIVSP